MNPSQSLVLVVDDNRDICDLLAFWLEKQGHAVATAQSGRQALEQLHAHSFDLMILDIMMPQMNGYQVLEYLKSDLALNYLPVIVISAMDDVESVIRCIELGAEDYLFKPINQVWLKARLDACLEKKQLRDKEQAYLQQLQAERAKLVVEQERSERLLLNILPRAIADRLKEGQLVIADSFPEVTLLFADIVDFSHFSAHQTPTELVNLLNKIFSVFDWLAEQHGLEKIKTIGDTYMAVGGVPLPRPDHAEAIADMALDMQRAICEFKTADGQALRMRIGINTGPVVAGVIGIKKFSYDLWGDAVNIASRMESHGLPDHIQVSDMTYGRLKDKYLFESRGTIPVKGLGEMKTYLLTGKKEVL